MHIILAIFLLSLSSLCFGVEPTWKYYKPQRQVNLGPILSDIEGHIRAGHPYSDSDKITWVHETTHGINADLRNKISPKVNAFYCLNDKYVVLEEPPITISQIQVPSSFHDHTYKLYLVNQRSGWNDRPLYIMDEWSAYLNEAEMANALKTNEDRYSNVIKFDVFSLCLCKELSERGYIDVEMHRFVDYQISRSKVLCGRKKAALNVVNTLRTASDCEDLRQFISVYLPDCWLISGEIEPYEPE